MQHCDPSNSTLHVPEGQSLIAHLGWVKMAMGLNLFLGWSVSVGCGEDKRQKRLRHEGGF